MQVYRNEYTKKEDAALWQLHEIRNQMARIGLKCENLNHSAHAIIRKYKLSGLKLVKSSHSSDRTAGVLKGKLGSNFARGIRREWS